MSDTDGATPGAAAFAEKLRLLFDSVRQPDGRPHSKAGVADALGVSRSYVYMLLAGQCEPGYSLVVKLARFFEVDLEYFADSPRARELTRQYELLAKLGEQQVHRLATRASELSPERLRSVLEFMDFQARQGEDDT
ncbi:helix-turn-helix domain-containing protein [Kutzneria kofuensis]|uniref:Transcriptional regulator with XRE-family HTH domain n=1 Tax=Kutzneria kofuensis TaxID=103725 RepID=A0A7W9NGS7_9PSEU|nr:helix-turn-helix transcriptional regulator [Kutzneria kofuensis]MBB5891368.1 transcriptional regulator with XRE-family HTH domain [Kutzneria kofuensis]